MNAEAPVIRPMMATDITDVVALQCRVYEPFFHESQTAFQTKLNIAPDSCLVAEYAGKIIGYAISIPATRHAIPSLDAQSVIQPSSPDRLYLHDMSILQEYRGYGLGCRFLNLLENTAKEKRFNKIVLIAVGGSSPFWMKHHFSSPDIMPEAITAKLSSYGPNARYLERSLF